MAPKSKTTEWQSKALWLAAGVSSLLVLAFAIYRSMSFGATKWAVVALTVFVAVLISRHEPKIPKLGFTFSPKNLFIFWTIIWAGMGGGIIVAFGAAAAGYFRPRADRPRRLFTMLTDPIAACAAAFVYLFGMYSKADLGGRLSAQLPTAAVEVASGVVLLALTHYVLTSVFSCLYLSIECRSKTKRELTEIFGYPAAGYITSGTGAVLFDYLFREFGVQFGLVLAPLAVIWTVVYTVHVRMLAIKTSEISDANRVHLATVEALATAIDARDQLSIGHVRRTQVFAIGLGELMGLSAEEIDAVRMGALLHDIGKLAVPDHILNKPEKLTPAEMEKTKIHASVGASILEKVGFDYPVVPTVRYHHERWDGGGYPEGLRGENIPLTARILSLADAYDSLRCDRPYRLALARDEAWRKITAESGKRFDPALVDLFFRNLHEFEAAIAPLGLSYREQKRNLPRPGESFVEEIKRANREVFTLYELALEFSSSLNLEETLTLFTTKVRDFVPFETCVVYLYNEATGTAIAAQAEGTHRSLFIGSEVAKGKGSTGQAIETRTAVRMSDPVVELAGIPSGESAYRSAVSLPLVAEDKLIGAVSLYSFEQAGYGEEHLRLLEAISRIAAESIDKSKRHAEAEHSALTDPMTGLPNARSLRRHFDKEAARALRTGSGFQVLMLDLDGFKQVNDTFGHKVGDTMLSGIGKAIGAQLRDYDFLARYAGDEFVAIIPDTSSRDVSDLCRRIEAAVKEFTLMIGDRKARVGVSIGAASFPQSGESFDQLLISADKKMYKAKSVRKNGEPARHAKKDAALPLFPTEEIKPPSSLHLLAGEEQDLNDELKVISSAIN